MLFSTAQASESIISQQTSENVDTQYESSFSKEESLNFMEDTIVLKICELLSSKNINMQDKNGFTALMYATILGNINLVKLLLDYGADVMLESRLGTNVFMIAQDSEREDLLEILSTHLND